MSEVSPEVAVRLSHAEINLIVRSLQSRALEALRNLYRRLQPYSDQADLAQPTGTKA